MLALLDFININDILTGGGLVLVWAIVFAESGILAGFFLPGDSLLFTAGMWSVGALEPQVPKGPNIILLTVGIIIAAIAGDQVGYLFGRRAGPALYRRRFVKKELVEKTQDYFEKHGGKTIVIARFIPGVRTFAPVVAGVGEMQYSHFLRFNVIGGLVWGGTLPLMGYFLGKIKWVQDNTGLVLLPWLIIPLMPVVYGVAKFGFEELKKRSTKGKTAS